ncbi:MAG: hypothetical protein P8X75_12570 [Limibacillus sp.]|jgi:hypothetical protein
MTEMLARFFEWLLVTLLCTLPLIVAILMFLRAVEGRFAWPQRLLRLGTSVGLGVVGLMLFFYFGAGLAFEALYR